MPETRPITRLMKRADFLKVAAGRKKWVTPGVIVQARKNPENDQNQAIRLGFTVSKKVGNAVQRNRAKRRLRAAADHILPGRLSGGVDLVLIGRKTTLDRPYSALCQDLETAIRRLKVLAA